MELARKKLEELASRGGNIKIKNPVPREKRDYSNAKNRDGNRSDDEDSSDFDYSDSDDDSGGDKD